MHFNGFRWVDELVIPDHLEYVYVMYYANLLIEVMQYSIIN